MLLQFPVVSIILFMTPGEFKITFPIDEQHLTLKLGLMTDRWPYHENTCTDWRGNKLPLFCLAINQSNDLTPGERARAARPPVLSPGIYPLWTAADPGGRSAARTSGCCCTGWCRWFFWSCHAHLQPGHTLQMPTHTDTHMQTCNSFNSWHQFPQGGWTTLISMKVLITVVCVFLFQLFSMHLSYFLLPLCHLCELSASLWQHLCPFPPHDK